MVDENSVVDRNSIKLVDESSVVVENTGLNLEEVDEKTVVYQSVFSPKNWPTVKLEELSTGECLNLKNF